MAPPIVVTARDERVTSRHKDHAQQKISKLERYFGGITRIETILSHDPRSAAAELVISVRGGKPLVCHANEQDLYAAIDVVLDKAEKVLTRHKEKLQSRKGHRAPTGNPSEVAKGGGEDSYQDIVDGREF